MSDIIQSLRDFVTTSNSGKYATEEELLSKFPEFQGYDVQLLRDFVATSNSGKYATEEELLSKFPEFGQQPGIKKKEEGFGRIFSQPFEQAQEAVDQLQEQKAQEQGVQLAPEGTFLRQMQTSSLASESAPVPLELPSKLEERKYEKYKERTPEQMQAEAFEKTILSSTLYEATKKAGEAVRKREEETPKFLKPSISAVDEEFLSKNPDAVKQELEYQFSNAGFEFDITSYQRPQDQAERTATSNLYRNITVKAPNGESKVISLRPGELANSSIELKNFLKENSAALKNMDALEKKYMEEDKKFTTQKAFNDDINLLNESAVSFNKEKDLLFSEKTKLEEEFKTLNSIPIDQRNTPAFLNRVKQYESKLNVYSSKEKNLVEKAEYLSNQEDQLKRSAAKYAEMKKTQGSYLPAIINQFLQTTGDIISGRVDLYTDFFYGVAPLKKALGDDTYEEFKKEKLLDRGFDFDRREIVLAPDLINKDINSIKKELDGKYANMGFEFSIVNRGGGFQELLVKSPEGQKQTFSKGFNISDLEMFLNGVSPSEMDEIDREIRDDVKKMQKFGKYKGLDLGTTKLEDIRDFLVKAVGSKSVSKEFISAQMETLIGGGILGTAGSLPAMIGTAYTRPLQFFAMSVSGLNREMEANPEFENVSENEKLYLKGIVGGVNAVLEEYGFRNFLKGRALSAEITKSLIRKLPTKVTTSQIRNAAIREMSEMGIKFGVPLVSGFLAEAETGTLQQINEYYVKSVYNELKGKEMFDVPEFDLSIDSEYVRNVVRAGIQEGIGGFIMTVPRAVSEATRKNGFEAMDDDRFSMFELMHMDSDARKLYEANLNIRINKGEITEENKNDLLNEYDIATGLFRQIPPEITDVKDKKKVMNLLAEKRKLQELDKVQDPALSKPTKKRIDEINEQLTKITQDAIQKQESGEVPVQSETGVGEAMVEGESETGLEVTPQESEATTQEEVTTKPSFTEQDNSRMNELSEALGRSDKRRKNITVGDTEMSRKDAQSELDALMQKQQQQQQTPEAAPPVSSKTESMTVEEQADLLERLIEESMTEPTTEPTTEAKTEPATEPTTKGRTRTKTKQEPELVTTQAPVVTPGMEVQAPAIETGVTPAVEPTTTPTTGPSTAPIIAPVTEATTEPTTEQGVDENTFTEADAERQDKLSEALSKASDSRVKFVKVDGEFVPKGEVVAELQRLFQKKLNQTNARARLGSEEEVVDQAEIDKITEEMNKLAEKYPQEAEMGEIESAGEISVENPIDTNPTPEPVKSGFLTKLLEFLGYDNKNQLYRNIREFAGMPMMIGISDSLGSGSFKDSVGKELKLDGGLLFNFFRNINKAWANVERGYGNTLVEQAKKVYDANKELFDRLWDEKKLPYGHIPYAIVRMGDEALLSNEAIYRYLSPWLKTLPLENRKAALEVFKAQMQEAAKTQSASKWLFDLKEKIDDGEISDFDGIIDYLESINPKDENGKPKTKNATTKAITKYENKLKALQGEDQFTQAVEEIDNSLEKAAPVSIVNFINKNNITTLDQFFDAVVEDAIKRAKGDPKNPSSLSLPLRAIITNKLLSPKKLTKITGGQPIYQALLGAEKNKLWDGLKYLTIPYIREQISEPTMLKARPGDVVAIMGINVLDGSGVSEVNHNNYGYGPNGRLIAYIKNPMRAFDVFPEIKARAAMVFKKNKKGKYPALATVVRESGGTVFSAKSFRGTKPVAGEMTKLDIIIAKLRTAFPDVSVHTTQEEFDAFLNQEGIRSRKDSNGNIIYGITKKGKIFLNPENKSLRTPIHEFGHIWIDYLRSAAGGAKGKMLLEKGFALVDGTKEYQEALRKYGDRQLALEEALVEIIATKGETIVNASTKSKFKNWLNAFFRYIKDTFKDTTKTLFKDKEFAQRIENLTLEEFIDISIADLFGMAEINAKFSAKDAVMAEMARKSVGMSPEAMIKLAKDNGIADEAIRMILTKKGFTEEKINELLGAEPTAREKGKEPKLSEDNFPGYDAIMDLVDAMIARQVKRGTPKDRLAKNLDNLLRKQDAYINATDAQKKALEQEARNRIGAEQRKAPSFGRILGAFKNLTTLTTKDKKKIVSNIMQLAKDAANDLANEIRNMKVNGSITTSQLAAIQKRLSKVNFTNEVSINAFVDYMAKVFNDVEYANKIADVRKLQSQVNDRKHMSMSQSVKQFTSINPELIPDNMLLPYIQALDSMNTNSPSYLLMNKIYNDITSLNQDGKEFDEIKTIEAMAKKWESISLNAVKSVEEYVALIRDINAYKRKAYQLFENGIISQEQYETLMDAVGKDQQAVEKKYEKELKKIKDELISEINDLRPLENENLSEEENELISKYLETKKEDLETLSPEQLYVLRDLLENLKNGEFDYFRLSEIVSKLYTNNDSELFNQELEQSNFDLREDQGLQMLAEYESSFWEGLLGLGRATSGALQKYIVTPFNRALASYESFIQKSANVFIKLKKKYNINDYGMHKIGMLTTYLQEYMAQFDPDNANEPNIGTRDWFKEIINNDSMRKKYKSKTGILRYVGMNRTEDEIIEKIWNSLPKDSNGNVDPKAVYDSYMANDGKYFTKKEKAFFDAVMQWKENNVTGKQKAANELRGNPFKSIAFHMTRVRLQDGKKQIDAKSTAENNFVRLEAGTGKERASQKVGAVMTNFEQLFYNNIEQTARDYYITKALKDINNILSSAKRSLGQDKMTLLNVISGTLSDALNFEFESNKSNPIAKTIMSAKVAEQLLDPIKTIRELFASFVSFPLKTGNISAYKELLGKVRNMKPLLEFTDSPLRLRDNISSAVDISDAKFAKMKFMEKTLIYLTGLPERTMMVTSWMPTFRQEFESITGVKFNEKSFKDSKAYREQYGKAIKEAAAVADAQTEKIIGTTTKAGQRRQIRIAPKFLANLVNREGTVDRNSVEGQILGFFSNYSYREISEFINGFREFAEVYKNYKSQKAGNAKALWEATKRLSKPFGIVLNIATYGYLTAVLYALELILLGDEEDEERGLTMLERLTTIKGFGEELSGNLIATAASKYSGGGRIGMQLMGTLGMMLTDDPKQKESIKNILKESVYVKPLPVDKATQYGGKDSVMASLANYIPHFALVADRVIETIGSVESIGYIYDKAEKNGIESLSKDEGAKVLALNTLISTLQLFANFGGTSIPAYNKIKTGMRTLKKNAGVDNIGTTLSEKKKAYGGYDTIDEFKLGSPKMYEKYSEEGGLLYKYREKNNKNKETSTNAKFKALEDRYGEDAIKDLDGYEKYKESKDAELNSTSTSRNTPSPSRNTTSPSRNTPSPNRY
jgi:hypothetical protein